MMPIYPQDPIRELEHETTATRKEDSEWLAGLQAAQNGLPCPADAPEAFRKGWKFYDKEAKKVRK